MGWSTVAAVVTEALGSSVDGVPRFLSLAGFGQWTDKGAENGGFRDDLGGAAGGIFGNRADF